MPTSLHPSGRRRSPGVSKLYHGMWKEEAVVSEGGASIRRVGATVNTKLAPKACAERERLPKFIGLDAPSTPMPK